MKSSVLLVLGAVLAYAAFRNGGADSPTWNLCLLAIGLLTLLHTGLSWRRKQSPPLNAALLWPLILLPAYVAFQLIPMGLDSLAALSPARAEMVRGAARVVPGLTSAPLSVAPSATLGYWMRLGACIIVFLLIRETVWRLGRRAWLASLPFVAIAGAESVLGLMQTVATPGDGFAKGTYINRVHFAALLEMALPFATALPLVLLRRYQGAPRLPGIAVA
ncbi:MAG: hypothetical protein ABIZ80_05230, partial [Bryobacteraceae bacterium]